MQNFFYCIKEGLSGLRRSRLSCLLSITTITISLLLIGSVLVFSLNMYHIVNSIRERMELEVFIDNSLSDDKVKELHDGILSIYGVKQVEYVSKEQAMAYFLKEFNQDIVSILDENPLPASFRINFIESFSSLKGVESIKIIINELQGIDEIVYRSEFIKLIDKYISTAYLVLIIGGALICVGAIFFVYNNIRLVIFSRRQIIETMKLVGATAGFIRFPFIIEGILQSLIGVLLAIGILYSFNKLLMLQKLDIVFPFFQIFGILCALSMLFGALGSAIAARRFLKY